MTLNLPPYPYLKFWNISHEKTKRDTPPLTRTEWETAAAQYFERWALAVEASSICVVDIDAKPGRVDGLAYARDKLQWNLERLVMSTYSARTKSGGLHLYFHCPPHINKKAKVGACIDLIAGPNNFVWCTPTPGYTALNVSDTLAKLPSYIEDLWLPKHEDAEEGEVKEVQDVEEYFKNCLRRARKDVASAKPGERNDVLNKSTYWLGQLGIEFGDVKECMVKATMTNGDFAEDEGKVLGTIKRAYDDGKRHPKNVVEKGPDVSPEEIRSWVIELLSPRYRRHGANWYEHKGTSAYWHPVLREDVEHAVLLVLPSVVKGSVLNSKKSNALLNSSSMLCTARCILSQWPTAKNTDDADVAMFSEVVIDTRTGHPIAGDNLFLTRRSAVAFVPEMQCPNWLKFLDYALEGDAEMVEWLRRAMAYSLTSAMHWQCLFFVYGRAKTGKSTFINVLSRLAGGYMTTAPDGLFVGSRGMQRNTELGLDRIKGARVVIQNEIAEGRRFNSDLLKAVSAGDFVEARALYQAGQTYQSTAKIWFVANDMPHFSETDGGLHRRMRIIPFDRAFPDQMVEANFYKNKLEPELPGILNWVVSVMPEVHNIVAPPPKRARMALEEVIEEESPLAQFCKDILLEDNVDGFTRFDQLFEAYQDWCRDTGRDIPEQGRRGWFSRAACQVLSVKSSQKRQGTKIVRGFKGFSINPVFITHKLFEN